MALHLFRDDWTSRARILCSRVFLAVSVTITTTYAQAAPAPQWRSECRELQEGRICVVSQSVRDGDGRLLATLRLQPEVESGLMQLLLPEGVHLGSGVFYALDDGPEQALKYQRCQNGRCAASAGLAKADWQALLKAGHIDLVYRPDAGSAPRKLRLSLQGVQNALQGLGAEASE